MGIVDCGETPRSVLGTRHSELGTRYSELGTRSYAKIFASMELQSIVVLTLHSPKEKVWGELVSLTPAGITLRGLDVNSFDEVLRQIVAGEPTSGVMATVFYPMNRVERMSLDESVGDIPSLAERFESKLGLSVLQFLNARTKL